MKCNCGVELFEIDLVDKSLENINSGSIVTGYKYVWSYRCPKCFKIKKEIGEELL